MGEMPISLRDGIWLQQVFVFELGVTPANPRNVDSAIDIYPRHVNPAWTEIARQRLRQPTHCKLRRTEGYRARSCLHAGSRAGEQHYAASSCHHRGRDLL